MHDRPTLNGPVFSLVRERYLNGVRPLRWQMTCVSMEGCDTLVIWQTWYYSSDPAFSSDGVIST
jgi:hypothetical protein